MLNFDFWDKLNSDFWDKEWPTQLLFWALVIVMLVILFFLITGYSREIAGLKAENATLRERLRLAHDAHAIVAQQVEILTRLRS
jgi:hypothetical protein